MPKTVKPKSARAEKTLDDALASSFPASDPVSFTTTAIPITDHDAHIPAARRKPKGKPYKLYGCKGCGSMIVEAAFAFAGLPFDYVEVPWKDTGWNSKALKKLNPLGQVPTLIMPDGSVMTESAAIILHLADTVPGFQLVPPPNHPSRAEFMRWLVFLIAAIYPTFTYGDDTKRWVGAPKDEGAGERLREATDEHRKKLWRYVEKQIDGPWVLGQTFSALDVYVWPMTHWRPGRAWFEAECPKLAKIGAAVKAMPVAKKIAARHKL